MTMIEKIAKVLYQIHPVTITAVTALGGKPLITTKPWQDCTADEREVWLRLADQVHDIMLGMLIDEATWRDCAGWWHIVDIWVLQSRSRLRIGQPRLAS